ncbi:MAG: 2-keto-4-pentenoate hydratase [Casimicrobiaceae bacterium]
MNQILIDEAAAHLAAARISGRPGARLPESCRPVDLESALAIQRRVVALLGHDVGGWKCSLPPAPGRINAAPILATTILRSSPCAMAATTPIVRIEPEIAFVMRADLPQRRAPYSEAEVRAAIAETRMVLELLGTRYADPTAVTWLEMLADCVQNQGLYVGPVLPGGPDAPPAAFPVTISGAGGVLSTHDGRHGDGHPLRPLVWLANFLAARGEGLRAGQVVTTGSYAGAIEVPLNELLTVTFGNLGAVTTKLVRKA